MTFQQLMYVITVAEEKSFSKAAQKLYIAQPSLSQYIINLEKKLNVTLFDRSFNPIRVTEAGQEFIDLARQILNLKDELDKKMEVASRNICEEVTVGVSPFRTSIYMPYVISKFRMKFPNVKVNIVEGYMKELESESDKNNIDLLINTLPINEYIYDYEYIGNERILLAVPPEFKINRLIDDMEEMKYENIGDLQLKKIKLNYFKNEPFIMLRPEKRLHEFSYKLCDNAGFKPNVVMENDNLDSALAMVLGGLGITFIPDTIVKYGNRVNNPIYYCIDDEEEIRQSVVAYKKNKELSSSAKEFIKILKEILL